MQRFGSGRGIIGFWIFIILVLFCLNDSWFLNINFIRCCFHSIHPVFKITCYQFLLLFTYWVFAHFSTLLAESSFSNGDSSCIEFIICWKPLWNSQSLLLSFRWGLGACSPENFENKYIMDAQKCYFGPFLGYVLEEFSKMTQISLNFITFYIHKPLMSIEAFIC